MTDIAKLHRRHFLVGSSGLALAVPMLASLLPRTVRAQTRAQKRLIALATDHGGVFPKNAYPTLSSPSSAQLYAASGRLPEHRVTYGALPSAVSGTTRVISNMLSAPSSTLTPSLLAKMNVMAGFDITNYIGHNQGAFIGNYAANDQGTNIHGILYPTIDRIIGGSSTFNTAAVKAKSINVANLYGSESAPLTRIQSLDLNFQAVQTTRTLGPLLDLIKTETTTTARPPQRLVQRVYEHYRQLTTGAFGDASRLSAGDRERLTRHMDMLNEIENRMEVHLECGNAPAYRDSSVATEQLRMAADLIVMALMCGATNVAVMSSDNESFRQDTNYTDWHSQIAHDGGGNERNANPAFQRTNWRSQQLFFQEVFVRIARGLDVEERDGQTFLDNSLVYWTQESGRETHMNIAMPVVTAGSAGGFFETGRFIDFRNHASQAQFSGDPLLPGVLFNQFLANVLQSMGIVPSVYGAQMQRAQPASASAGMRGYGVVRYDGNALNLSDEPQNIWAERYYRDGDRLLKGWAVGA